MKKKNLILIILGCLFSFGIGVGFMGFLSKETPFKNPLFAQELRIPFKKRSYILKPKGWAVQVKGVTGPLQKCRLIQNDWDLIRYQCFNPHTEADDFFTYQILGPSPQKDASCSVGLTVKNTQGEIKYADSYLIYTRSSCGPIKDFPEKNAQTIEYDYLFLRTSPRSSVLKGEALPSFQNPIFYEPMQGDRLANFFTFHLTPMTWESQDGQINDSCSLIEDGYTYVKLKCLFTTPEGKKESLIYTFYEVGIDDTPFASCEIAGYKIFSDSFNFITSFSIAPKNCSIPNPHPFESKK